MTAYPNLIVAGAPKCGTTSFYRWLCDHPAACGSRPKETFYLMDPVHPLRRTEANIHTQGLEGYRRFFAHCSNSATVRFEATTHYIYQQTIQPLVANLPSRPQVLFLLRDPVQRAWSSYRYSQNNLANVSDQLSFAEYVDATLENRFASIERYFFDSSSAYVLRRDIAYGRYVEYLLKWRREVGAERINILLFENLKGGSRSFMKEVAHSFGLAPSFYDDYSFPAKNKSFEVRSHTIHRMARLVNNYLEGGGKIKDVFQNAYLHVQKKKQVVTEADRTALAKLKAYYAPYNRRLEDEFDLDLSAWSYG